MPLFRYRVASLTACRCGAAALLVMIGAAKPADAQVSVDRINRDNRVVLYSPHFDRPSTIVGMGCPWRPVRFFGFEDTTRVAATPTLGVRVFRDDGVQGEFTPSALNYAIIRLTARLVGGAFVDLQNTKQSEAITDTTGFARVTAPTGVYRILILRIGYQQAEGIVQVRPGASDSVHVIMSQQRLC
jgi:hypothetical protein